MMLQMIGAFAEFERSMVRERTRMGLQAARERGRAGGRKAKLKPNQVAEILRMVNSGNKTAAEAARLFGLHRSSISREDGYQHRRLSRRCDQNNRAAPIREATRNPKSGASFRAEEAKL